MYKVKKPVYLGFLDFRTLRQRRHFCQEEVRLNRRLAPDTYLGVVTLKESRPGIQIGGLGLTVEVAVEVRPLPAERMLDRLVVAGRAETAHVRRRGDRGALPRRGGDRRADRPDGKCRDDSGELG